MLKFATCPSGRTPISTPTVSGDRPPKPPLPQHIPHQPGTRLGPAIDMEMIFKGYVTHRRSLDRLAKYRPLFDGSDPDGILPLVQTWQALTRASRAAIGPYLPYGIFADWVGLLTVNGMKDPQQQITDLQFKKTWEQELNIQQRTVLLKFLTQNGVSGSDYGRPLFNADPDGVLQMLATMGKEKR
ncbi:MAG: hypothetical protein AAGG51_01205 [Cyanobacteria bacterium P01_G01_bin.54]